MNIAILGTRGIPNMYGGFEQCAEQLSLEFIKYGHKVTVYNPDDHKYPKNEWNGVKIVRIFSKEKYLGSFSTFLFDYLCLKDAIKKKNDIILELGYNPAGIYFKIAKKSKSILIVNMDGLEWKRSKWNKLIQKYSLYCEKKGANGADYLVADNLGIKRYLEKKYQKEVCFIPYGAEIHDKYDHETLNEYNIKENQYFLLIARLEKENNIELILNGYIQSKSNFPFLVIGKNKTKYGKYLVKKYQRNRIFFLDGIYNYEKLSNLRYYARIYFHGHSVGGTNPSLLEAMGTRAKIAIHGNEFNKNVVHGNSAIFNSVSDVVEIINNWSNIFSDLWVKNNLNLITDYYNWQKVSNKYLQLFENAIRQNKNLV